MMRKGIKELIATVLSLYDSAPVAQSFFSASRKRLEDLLYRIGSSQTRIAVIGITSSGKSTLLNAVLGQDLLPTGVAPSSGRQVLCGYDTTLHADFIFTPDSGKKRLVATKDIKRKLRQYGDERNNPGNREQIDEIHVYSPYFKFDHELIFVDTPGLDAYKLGVHEEITLKLVLPTVDMIMFLTNVKCDSDGQNLEFIDRSTSDVKPLVVVQNKIDSISAKISKRGVEKTVEDIRQEHLDRLHRLLSGAQKESVRKAPVVQVSAKAPWPLSNLETLKKILSEQIRLNSSFRESLFLQQFIREIKETQTALSSILAESRNRSAEQAKREKSMAVCKGHIQSVVDAYHSLRVQIQTQFDSARDMTARLLTAIDAEYVTKTSLSAEKKYKNPERLSSALASHKDALSRKINEGLNKFSNGILGVQAAIKVSCGDLNLQESQVVRVEFFGTASVAISNCQKVVKGKYHPPRRVKQSGLWGWIKRTVDLGDNGWGYDDVPGWSEPDTTVCDIPKLIGEIKGAFAHLEKFLNEKVPIFCRNTDYSVQCLQNEYDRRMQEIREQFQVKLPLEQGNMLSASLQKILDNVSGNIGIPVPRNAAQKPDNRGEELLETSVEDVVLDTLKTAENMALECHWSLVQEIIQDSGMVEKYICGWDINCMENFRDIFFRDRDEIKIIDFSAPNGKLPGGRSLVFLLINAEQSGSSAKKIFQPGGVSDFIRVTAEDGKIVWVMDSVKGFVSMANQREDTLIEAYIEMLKIARSVLKKRELFEVMACSRELYYTVLFHELYFNISRSPGEKNRQQFVEEMSGVFRLDNERKHATGQYVNHFLNFMKG